MRIFIILLSPFRQMLEYYFDQAIDTSQNFPDHLTSLFGTV
jgi:hypothetical protein